MNPTLTDTFRRLLAEHEARGEHVDPVVIGLPPDLDPADRESAATFVHRIPEPPMFAAPALLAAASLSFGVPPMPGDRDLFRVPTKAPKPPPDAQDAIQAAAEDRRDRKRVRNLRNIGHSADCATDMAIGHRPCSCSKAWGLV